MRLMGSEMTTSDDALLDSIVPFFIVRDVHESVSFYEQKLGFTLRLLVPEEDPFFAIVRRGPVAIILKQIGSDVPPVANASRHDWAPWDALIYTRDPDALYAERSAKGVTLHSPLADTEDELRAFEIMDNDGYVLCFAWPLDDRPA